MTTSPLPPAGWYPDPHGVAEQRWWDGQSWTEHVHPAPQPTMPAEPTATVAPLLEGDGATAPREDDTTARYPASWSAKKQVKKATEAAEFLFPGEQVIYQGSANGTKPLTTDIVVTDVRIFRYSPSGFGAAIRLSAIADVVTKPGNSLAAGSIAVAEHSGESIKLSAIPAKDVAGLNAAIAAAREAQPAPEALAAAEAEAEAEAVAKEEAAELAAQTIYDRWPNATILGKPSKKEERSVRASCHADETPWLVLAPGLGTGLLAAFEDRLAIIKTGAMTSLMAGALGGERNTTFYFNDITGIEYNSGFANGVLEVLTASYQGTANRDFWRGTARSRNADSNDPYTLSNTLPLPKYLYAQWAPQLQELRSRIAVSKRPTVHVVQAPGAAPAGPDLATQLQNLAALRDSGVLSEEEFAAAKARLLTS
ncbi:DUF2510 domain-containing protein [Microbacterium ureisolvens]|uniref:DUF2510 domain-containing protein n=1 Tax=Microbacterium ureisolvens TaxID=2781186 RepID=UPI0036417688